MQDQPEYVDPALVVGLREYGLLTLLSPEQLIDPTAATALADALSTLLDRGLLDDFETSNFQGASISLSRLGFEAAPELIEPILEELRARNLAGSSEDGFSLPIHGELREIVLTLLSQILRRKGSEQGLDLAPATDRPRMHHALTELLDAPSLPSAGHVLELDAKAIGVDLSSVGLDEILEFRERHGPEFRAYATGLRGALAELAGAPDTEARRDLLAERQGALNEAAEALAGISASHWRRPASFMLGIGGAAWAALANDPLGALVSAVGIGIEALPEPKPQPDAYSYICRAQHL